MCSDRARRRLNPILARQTSGKLALGFVLRISRDSVAPFYGKIHFDTERAHWPLCGMAGQH